MPASQSINIEQFLDQLEPHADSRGVVSGVPAKKAMRALNIRPITRIDTPSDIYGVDWDDNSWRTGRPGSSIGSNERLYTRQSHFHLPTLREYAKNPHSWEEGKDPDTGEAYLPQVYSDYGTGRQWIEEGHHRIMAARLNEDDVQAWRGRSV